MKKEKQQTALLTSLADYNLRLSNSATNNKEEALKRLIDAARELGFAEAQEQCVANLEDILEGKE